MYAGPEELEDDPTAAEDDGWEELEEDPEAAEEPGWEELEDDGVLVEDADDELEGEPLATPPVALTPVELVQPDGTEPGPPATKRMAAHWPPSVDETGNKALHAVAFYPPSMSRENAAYLI